MTITRREAPEIARARMTRMTKRTGDLLKAYTGQSRLMRGQRHLHCQP